MSKVVYEGWMARYGRRKLGRSFIHMRYFILESRLLAYYKKKPKDNAVPLKTLLVDGNCRVEDRGLKTHHGLKVYVLCVYNKKEKSHRITMAAFNIQEAHIWKEKIEIAIDQHQEGLPNGNNAYTSLECKSGFDDGRIASSSDRDSQYSPDDEEETQATLIEETTGNDLEDEDERNATLMRRTTIGNGIPDSVLDWTDEVGSGLSSQTNSGQVFSRKHWRLIRCQNGLRIFEELVEVDYLPRSCSKAMKAVGVVDATCEEIFELVMNMDGTRFEWDCSFQYGNIVEEVDGHTAILYHRLLLDWFPLVVWPRDLCYVRYWRRNEDGSYVVLFRSREHANCGPQPGFVRAHIESGGFKISPLRSRNGRPRTQVQHLMQIDLKGWGLGYFPPFQQHCLLQMLNSVAGLREWFTQMDDCHAVKRIPVMVNMSKNSVSLKEGQNAHDISVQKQPSLDHMRVTSGHSVMEEYSDEEEEYQIPEPEQEADIPEVNVATTRIVEEPSDKIDRSCFSGNLHHDDHESSRDCWRISDGKNFRVRSKHFVYDKTKIPAGKHMMELVAVDWFKDVKRMDHVARHHGCAAQVASDRGHFSLVINVQVEPGSLLQHFIDADDEFRNSRLKLIPSVPKGSWIVRQSVGSTPCLLGKAVDCTYIREPNYLEIDVDIGSSTVANGVLGLVFGVITTLVVEMAFLIQANTYDELPERLIGAVRVSHVGLKSAVTPVLETNQQAEER